MTHFIEAECELDGTSSSTTAICNFAIDLPEFSDELPDATLEALHIGIRILPRTEAVSLFGRNEIRRIEEWAATLEEARHPYAAEPIAAE